MTNDADETREEPADTYGRHSRPHAQGSSVRQLLLRFIRAGQPIRLAWPTAEPTADQREEFPTAILPIISSQTQAAPSASATPDGDDDGLDTEPSTATRQARRWPDLRHRYRLSQPKSLVV